MKIFHFILDHRIGGPHVYVRTVARALAPEVTSTLVTTGCGEATEVALTNLRHRFKLLYPLEIVWNVIALCWRFRHRDSRHGVIFDVHGAANIAPVLAGWLLRMPLVWHFHETLSSFVGLARFGKAVAAGIPHRYVVVAAKAAEVFDVAEAVLIPAAVDTEFWHATPVATEALGNGGILRLVAVGNLNPLKGMDILLDALDGLDLPWELVIVGAELQTFSEYAVGLRDQASRLARGGRRVVFSGWQPPEVVRGLLERADVFVLPSRSEACPIALLEAMAMERACVAADVGDVRKMLSAPGSGIVAPRESPTQLAEALAKVAALGPARRQEMGRRARVSVTAGYSQQQMVSRHLEIYTELLREAEERT